MDTEGGEAGLSTAIAVHVARSEFEHLPAATIVSSKRAILDGLGVMLAASGTSTDILPFVELARAEGGRPRATLLGFDQGVSLPMAALANGAMAHALDFEDAFDPGPMHPNASLLPAVFALAEARAPVTGRDFITAVAIGCDLACRLALSLRQPLESGGWYPPPILGAYGSVAASARVLRLGPTEIVDAFSLLLGQNSCPGEIKYSRTSLMRAVREAFPCQAAVQSVLLAERGVKGYERPLEGVAGFFRLFAAGRYDPSTLLENLGERYWIEQLSFKKWPCCRGAHACIEAAQTLRRRHGFRADQVTQVRIKGDALLRMLYEPTAQKRAPRTLIDAKFSLPFTVAAALIHDEVTLGSFTPDTLGDAGLLALATRVEFEPFDDGRARGAAACDLSIELDDGRVLHHQVAQALGGPDRPMDEAALDAKFGDCAARAAVPLSAAKSHQLAQRLWALEQEPDVGALLTSTLRPTRNDRPAAWPAGDR
jgi:2-methylcitrate dehydratase PrpD